MRIQLIPLIPRISPNEPNHLVVGHVLEFDRLLPRESLEVGCGHYFFGYENGKAGGFSDESAESLPAVVGGDLDRLDVRVGSRERVGLVLGRDLLQPGHVDHFHGLFSFCFFIFVFLYKGLDGARYRVRSSLTWLRMFVTEPCVCES